MVNVMYVPSCARARAHTHTHTHTQIISGLRCVITIHKYKDRIQIIGKIVALNEKGAN